MLRVEVHLGGRRAREVSGEGGHEHPPRSRETLGERGFCPTLIAIHDHGAIPRMLQSARPLSPRDRRRVDELAAANAMGRALLAERPRELAARLRDVALDRAPASSVRDELPLVATRLSVAGLPPYFLVVVREAAGDVDERLAEASVIWRLTPRQRAVVREVVRGESNKGIAERLGIVESTVELHVTASLRKAGVESRAALVARFWSGER